MGDCIFCKIVNGKIPAVKVWEDKDFYAFLDINPVNYGHTLLIPKEHYKMMTNMPDKLLSNIYVRARELMKIVKKSMAADYVVLSVVGLDVPHFHIHLIPRYNNDGLANFWPTKKYNEWEMEKIAEKIKMALTNET